MLLVCACKYRDKPGFHECYQKEGKWFSQADKTIWTELLFKKNVSLDAQTIHWQTNHSCSQSNYPVLNWPWMKCYIYLERTSCISLLAKWSTELGLPQWRILNAHLYNQLYIQSLKITHIARIHKNNVHVSKIILSLTVILNHDTLGVLGHVTVVRL